MRWLALVLVLPFLLLAAFKPGTMLAADAQGRIMVLLCGGHGPVEMAVGLDGTLTPVSDLGHDPAPAKAPCGWALHGQPALTASGPVLPVPVRLSIRLAEAAPVLSPALVHLPGPAWPRGPPRAA
ncbi:DUF2946 family protein [Paracoccus yeei]|uniref:DUF2946 family protein n=1 Tax=Paracoccus yeei TaxID=147645 RepID=UPI0028D773EC|nr:DUF2946 family protein [Paracoccus yeei]